MCTYLCIMAGFPLLYYTYGFPLLYYTLLYYISKQVLVVQIQAKVNVAYVGMTLLATVPYWLSPFVCITITGTRLHTFHTHLLLPIYNLSLVSVSHMHA